MPKERLYLYDTTLRDGAQTAGLDMSLADKCVLSERLDAFGIDYIEGGYPGANPLDTEFFSKARLKSACFTAFGMGRRAGVPLSEDTGFCQLLDSQAKALCLLTKSWDYHVRVALGISQEDNLAALRESIYAAREAGKEVLVDCEHFFDGIKANPDYALKTAQVAFEAGARWVVLCDTNGGSMPHEVMHAVEKVMVYVPGTHLGIHAHNDTEQAVANSLAAVRAGVRQIQGTINGIGERCGNANLVSLIPTLKLKSAYAERFTLGITDEDLGELTRLSRMVDDLLNRMPNPHAPYVGAAAFTTKAGIHASALVKDPATYEHIAPESVGNVRRILVSDQAGRSNLLQELNRLEIPHDPKDPRLDALLREIKEKEALGYAYETADASLALLLRRRLAAVPCFFTVHSYRVDVEKRRIAKEQFLQVCEAIVKVEVDGQTLMSVAQGNGPVHALDLALRKDLGRYQSQIAPLVLEDYKVRILTGGTQATTRVLIESQDTLTRTRWVTLGVSDNIVEASLQALVDSITYKLLLDEIQR